MHSEVQSLLIDIEAELRRLDAWDAQSPPAAALASRQPFAFDTLTLPQWLQFIFLPAMQGLVDREAALPSQCGVAPVAEEYFRGASRDAAALIGRLAALDALLSGGVFPETKRASGGKPNP